MFLGQQALKVGENKAPVQESQLLSQTTTIYPPKSTRQLSGKLHNGLGSKLVQFNPKFGCPGKSTVQFTATIHNTDVHEGVHSMFVNLSLQCMGTVSRYNPQYRCPQHVCQLKSAVHLFNNVNRTDVHLSVSTEVHSTVVYYCPLKCTVQLSTLVH
jgi:hypothetical protein